MLQTIQSIINILSFSFQISGAVLLLLWSLSKCDKKIKQMSMQDNMDWGDFNGNIVLEASTLQKNAKTLYLNIAAFINIIWGYTCSIFSTEISCPLTILIYVIIATLLILFIEYLVCFFFAKIKYSQNCTVNTDEL